MGKLRLISVFLIAFLLLASKSYSDTSSATPTVMNEKLEMAENNPIANMFCRVYDTVLVVGFVVAALLWTITGIGFFIGKISWGIVIAIGIGSALMVGSSKLAANFVLGDSDIEDACKCRYGVNCDSPYE
jgi:hypothetical protein